MKLPAVNLCMTRYALGPNNAVQCLALALQVCQNVVVRLIVRLLAGCLTSQQHAGVPKARICSDNCTCCTLREKSPVTLSISCSFSILTPGQPVPVLTLYRQASGRVATGVPMFKSLAWLDPKKSPWGKIPMEKAGIDPGSAALEADTLTTWPTRRSLWLSGPNDY